VLDRGGSPTPHPSSFTAQKETRYPLYRRLGGSPDHPACSELLHRLSYPILATTNASAENILPRWCEQHFLPKHLSLSTRLHDIASQKTAFYSWPWEPKTSFHQMLFPENLLLKLCTILLSWGIPIVYVT